MTKKAKPKRKPAWRDVPITAGMLVDIDHRFFGDENVGPSDHKSFKAIVEEYAKAKL